MFGMHEAVLFCSYLTETLPVNLSDADISQYFKIKVDLTGFLSAIFKHEQWCLCVKHFWLLYYLFLYICHLLVFLALLLLFSYQICAFIGTNNCNALCNTTVWTGITPAATGTAPVGITSTFSFGEFSCCLISLIY